jgi:uncharacterized protein DUF2252
VGPPRRAARGGPSPAQARARSSHAAFEPPAGRDPIAILERQETDRLPDLVPLRHARMAESPFAYYRGTPAVMASDLATTPRTDIVVQASGDAYLSNFGLFASPERRMVFDANDFDETLPGPWNGRSSGWSPAMRLIDVWYPHITRSGPARHVPRRGLPVEGRHRVARSDRHAQQSGGRARRDGTGGGAVLRGRCTDSPPGWQQLRHADARDRGEGWHSGRRRPRGRGRRQPRPHLLQRQQGAHDPSKRSTSSR